MNNGGNNGGGGQRQAWLGAGLLGLGIAAAVGTAAYLFGGRQQPQQQQNQPMPLRRPPPQQPPSDSDDDDQDSAYLRDMVSRLVLGRPSSGNSNISHESGYSPPPENPIITNLNGLLHDIYVRYLRLKDSETYYKVFDVIFNDLHRKMKEVDPYYRRYSSTVQFAGSHFDKLRIDKLDEFDMDVVIGLPLNIDVDPHNPAESDFVIEAKAPGFLQLRMGVQYKRLHMRDVHEWPINKTAFEWQDSSDYLLRSKFIEWFEGVVAKALNRYEVSSNRPLVYVEGVPYILNLSKSGPAITVLVTNTSRNFKMDFDLVPALKFPESRWPISKSYRSIPSKCEKGYWMVVPKPNKKSGIPQDEARSWRIALHNQERELMYNSYNLKQTIRLIKKLRDSLRMNMIASYYIKTLFFWEIEAIRSEEYWRKSSPAVLFKQMVQKLYEALVIGKIPYYWDKRNNLIEGVPYNVLNEYAKKLLPLIQILEDSSQYKLVAKYLLTPSEFSEYNTKYLHI